MFRPYDGRMALSEPQNRADLGRLTNRVALVTGAASGIGKAVAQRFVAEGAQVVAGDIDQDGLDALAAELGDAVRVRSCDVTDEDSVASLAQLAGQVYGRLDIAVANAGAGTFSPLVDHPLSEWQRILDLCLTGVFLTVKHAARAMVAHGNGGSIISIASLNAVQPAQGMAAYCAAKAGVVMLDQVAALELGPHGIRVNSIAPGLVETAATGTFFSMPAVVNEFIANAPIGRYAQPAEIASLATFLASDEASFITGTTHHIDGGAQTGRYPRLFDLF
jgi:NAD(P)-dependent dehydrogenase (short-subunit alcohol dehydrogenase family)